MGQFRIFSYDVDEEKVHLEKLLANFGFLPGRSIAELIDGEYKSSTSKPCTNTRMAMTILKDVWLPV
eukprot:694380-Amphidinium_carterae.1